MKVSYRTIEKPLNDYFPDLAQYAAEKIRPVKIMRKFVANSDFQGFKHLQRLADKSDIRFHMSFPEDMGDKIVLQIADRRNPTMDEIGQIILGIFAPKKAKLPTMTPMEGLQYFGNVLKCAFNPKAKMVYPTKEVVINPEKPFFGEIKNAIREFANERLFGVNK